MSVHGIVFSRNRPLQLDGLLRSMEGRVDFDTLSILYRADSGDFERGYSQVRPRGASLVRKIRDDGKTFLPELALIVRGFAPADLVVFHCDDDLYFRPVDRPQLQLAMFSWQARLGVEDTTHCAMNEIEHRPSGRVWDWTREDPGGDLGYPFSLDGGWYRAGQVQTLISIIGANGPNDFENIGVSIIQSDPSFAGRLMGCGQRQALVSIPWNRVNDGYPNPDSGRPELSAEALNERWLAGEWLALERMDFSEVHAAHALVEPVFEPRP